MLKQCSEEHLLSTFRAPAANIDQCWPTSHCDEYGHGNRNLLRHHDGIPSCCRESGGTSHLRIASGVLPREEHSLETQASSLRTAERAKRLARPLRIRDGEAWLPTTEERWQCLRVHKECLARLCCGLRGRLWPKSGQVRPSGPTWSDSDQLWSNFGRNWWSFAAGARLLLHSCCYEHCSSMLRVLSQLPSRGPSGGE